MKNRIGGLSRRNFIAANGVAAGVSAYQPSAKADPRFELPIINASKDSAYKQQARADYAKNFGQYGGTLSSTTPPDVAVQSCGEVHYDVLIVGSGYGASIMAARLAQKMKPGVRLAVLERGAEWVPGTMPDTLGDVAKEARLRPLGFRRRTVQNPIGLYNIVQTNELMIVSGSGLGGCSLVNASVALKPDRETFMQPQWPFALQDRDVLEPYYERAAWELGVQCDPIDFSKKMRAERIAAERLRDIGCHFEAAGLTITRGQNNSLPIFNRQGILQRNCIDCGDCMIGCNVGAKNTLAMNYLPIAKRHGAMLFTQCEVRRIHKRNGHYVIEYWHHTRDPNGDVSTETRFVSSRMVILAAGSLGSSEILLRSRDTGFCFSNTLGMNWTANGDALGFVDNSQLCPSAGGIAAYPGKHGPGPTIQSNLTYPSRHHLHDRVLIQDGAIASVYTQIIKMLFLDLDLSTTLPLLGMGHDGQQGRVVLHEDGNADVLWPGLLKSPYRNKIRAEFELIAKAHGGKYRHLHPPHDRMITVHPLGGCGMSDDPRSGVVDHRGRVYDLASGGSINEHGEYATHQGLYICDGAIYPTAIAVNPFFTIAAMAERNAQLLTLQPEHADLFNM